MNIPDYITSKDEEEFSRWLSFANFVRSHNSEYMTREDRELMILNLYQLERGYAEDGDILKAKEMYRPFLSQVSDKLGGLILIKNRDYNWENFIKNFTKREVGADFVDIVSHDLMIIERTKELYNKLLIKQLKFDETFSNTFDKACFKLAKLLREDDEKNYIV